MHEPTTIELERARSLIITWDDGRVDRLSAALLRSICPCAGCRNAPAPLTKEQLEATEILNVELVGAYAINLTFSPDRHSTGIYPYGLLRDIGEESHVT